LAAAHHHHAYNLEQKFEFTSKIRRVVFALMIVGAVLIGAGYLLAPDSAHEDSHASVNQAKTELNAVPVSDQHPEEHGATKDEHGTAHADEAHADEAHADEAHAGGHGHHAPDKNTRMLANLLLASLYFLTIAMGAMFFITIHRVGNAGWYVAVQRVVEAMTQYLPYAFVGFLLILPFLGNLFEWAIIPAGEDAIIDAKRAWLNEGSFIFRTILFFGIWIGTAILLRRLSIREDVEGHPVNNIKIFEQSTRISAIFIILFALSYSLFAIDWIKSLEPHWFSTIFGINVFAGSMVSAMVTLYLLILFLKSQGYLEFVNESHLHDIGKFTFGFSIFWAYTWVSQYMLIWYSNIPEEGIYYVKRYRIGDHEYLGYAAFFYLNIIINFLFPFLWLMTRNAKRKLVTFLPIGIILLYGHWHDLFLMIMPGAVLDNWGVGLMELGFFTLFAGVFLFAVFNALQRANLVPLKHPYLEESLHHTTGAV
jgi:hypothetical protein